MDFDHLAQEQSDRIFHVWIRNLLSNAPEELAGKLAARHCPGQPVTASRLSNGAFNLCYRVTFENGHRVIVRFTALGRVVARSEKVEDEVSIMQYLSHHTKIPVPRVFRSGKCVIGPYIVISFIEGSPLSGYLRDPSQEVVTLSSSLSTSILKRAYSGMAELLLELSKPKFPFIGSIQQNGMDVWNVQKGPFTFNINRLAQFSNLPLNVFDRQRFSNTADYFEELANHHLHHLELQRNDAITDEDDCQKKYIARCLFRKVSREVSQKHCNGPFRLYCDDLRPKNVLVDASKLVIAGVVNWEFTYAAPVEFTYAAPWWLLLEHPEDWDSDLNDFMVRFMPRFRTFLEALQECEDRKILDGSLLPAQRLSTAMEQSLETGMFWICLALRHSSMFDEIYWTFIDSKFFGPFGTMEDRFRLLSAEEQANIDSFVEKKLLQAQEGGLVYHYTIDELVDL
ncbi:uncharacterized protein N7459_004100 [Penicillium hispanicum]|uniref:uncharacterized protein n=1 Tax=Penicillium hispanicum TaxID=1080232 RepID=UPI00253FDC5E|nr:uncharacterized protein N7459_004100 [Penicillium hispanicum]KAJ5584300.1 hypothetical protein N7459_004100 [Penicillium hispanicum]